MSQTETGGLNEIRHFETPNDHASPPGSSDADAERLRWRRRTTQSRGSASRSPDAVSAPATAPIGRSLPQGDDPIDLDPADFTAGSDNRYFPLEPRRQWIYKETDEAGASLKVVVTVSTETRKIANGVVARVVRDTVTEEGQLIEDTFDWYAQDGEGNVWYLGEQTAEFENGKLTTREGSFEADVDGALPEIIMPAEPQVGISYRQEYYKGEAEDNGLSSRSTNRPTSPRGTSTTYS